MPGTTHRAAYATSVLLLAAAVVGTTPAAYISRLDAWAGRGITVTGDPGAVLVVVNARGVIHCRAFGLDASRRPMTCKTPFAVASLTKSFTALEVVALAQRGRIDLAAPVRTYLPWFRVADARASEVMTIEDVLTQRTGLTEPIGRTWLASNDADTGALERRVRALAKARLASSPGSVFAYSNANYDVLGAVIAAVRATSFETAMSEDVLVPLGLAGARFSRGDPAAAGYSRVFGIPVSAPRMPAIRGDAPAAGLVIDGMTYGRYLAAQLDAGRTWTRAVALPHAWNLAHHSPDGSPYAMGWFEDVGPHVHQLRHAGSAPDFSTWAIFFPERGIGAAMLTNAAEPVSGGRSDWLRTGIQRILTDREPPRAPPIALELVAYAGATAGVVLMLWTVVGAWRDSSTRGALTRFGLSLTVLVVVPVTAFPRMGWSLSVGYLYAPDFTVMVAVILAGAAVSLVLSVLRLIRGGDLSRRRV